jgi:hypothetical protein
MGDGFVAKINAEFLSVFIVFVLNVDDICNKDK